MTESKGRGPSLHTLILLGLVLGAASGIAVNRAGWNVSFALKYFFDPIGQVFLRMLLMTVVPLVFTSLAVGVAQLGDLSKLGRIGAKTFAYFVGTMSIAVVIGLFLVNTVRPGDGFSAELVEELRKTFGAKATAAQEKPTEFGIETFVSIVPRNPIDSAAKMDMLGIIFFALLTGIALTRIEPTRGKAMLTLLEAIADVMVWMINLAMMIAPLGVFALIFSTCSRFGFDLLVPLGKYVAVVLAGLAIQLFGVLSLLVATMSRLNPLWFFNKIRSVILTAFSTSSSNATLPTSIRISEQELGVPSQIAGFVLPLGATMNMNGTALFEGVTVVFLAQVFHVPLSLGDQCVVVLLSVLTAIGAAGVPGGSIPLLILVLTSVGVPGQGIAIILGVDRLLDMCRTTLNVVGDITAATYITRSEGYHLRWKEPEGIQP